MCETGIGENSGMRVRMLVEGALCIALAVVLSYLKLFRMPQGGSITLEMAPLIFYSYRYGFKRGFSVGAIAGLLTMIFGGYIAHPLQAILDYPLAFAVIGFAGLLPSHPLWGAVVAGLARLACHVLSGVVFFGAYAPSDQNVWIYSTVYNATFMLPSLVISVVLVSILYRHRIL